MLQHSPAVLSNLLPLCLLLLLSLPGCWLDGRMLCSTSGPPFLIARPGGGLNNQRWSLLMGLLYAQQRNLTYVLPSDVDLDTRNSSCPAARRKKLQPFSAIYDVRQLARTAAAHGPALISDWSRSRQELCCAIAHRNEFVPPEGPRPPGHCIDADLTFVEIRRRVEVTLMFNNFAPDPWRKRKGRLNTHLFYVMNPQLEVYRKALAPAPAFAAAIEDVAAQLRAKVGPRPYAVVHARFEDDFRWMETMERRFHMMTEAEVTRRLAARLPPRSPIQVCSGIPKAQLRDLCSHFECFQIFDVRLPPAYFRDCPPEKRPRDLLALFDFFVALHGSAFYGNLASSFSAELYVEFVRRGKPAAFLNWDGFREL
eukprot:GGOE01019771.1.p1 GENE.GGOE01019771.1~~GGOE01019771.1.p1  ORF type:complete len:368 (+),score=87.64 GGOE01019771.1:98-1201(+)